ncbi:hypothetical protein MKEN_00918800 [Mycena kentingensis (nom. inval.)]|nr:hypothetical protein MKEN_00918800 [Mycena kentingensis (nom. inval.)]
MNPLSLFFLVVFTLFSAVTSAPTPTSQRDVFSPPVLYPRKSTVWHVGEKHNVTWDMSKAPKRITNNIGMIVLVKDHILDLGEFNVLLSALSYPSPDHPLAQNFPINISHHEITVPKVKPGHTYQILVFGDSGNTGEMFTILE